MLFMEHCLIGVKVIMSNLVDPTPLYIQKKVAMEKARHQTAAIEERLRVYK